MVVVPWCRWGLAQTGGADAMTIEVSSNGKKWTKIGNGGNAAAGSWQTLSISATARYVRFSFANPNKDAQLGYVAEVKITA